MEVVRPFPTRFAAGSVDLRRTGISIVLENALAKFG
jgi:hypothetical protein